MTNATALTRRGSLKEATRTLQEALCQSAPYCKPVSSEGGFSPPYPSSTTGCLLNGTMSRNSVNQWVPEHLRQQNPPDSTPSTPDQYRREPVESPSAGQTGFSSGEFSHAGLSIPYQLYIPVANASGPMPLLVLLHGCTQDAADFATGTNMNAVADEHGIAVLYPSQTARANVNKCWNWFEPAHQHRGAGEPAVLSTLTQQIIASHNFDPHRVFVAGMSAGGAMAVVLGEQYPDVFAAVGVHSGLPSGVASNVAQALSAMKGGIDPTSHQQATPHINASATPTSARIQPTIVFHGARDRTVDAANGQGIVNSCLRRASMLDEHIVSQSSQRVSGPNAVTVTIHRDSTQRVICEYWHLLATGHQWSGGNPAGTHTDAKGPDASAEMVRFFLANVAAHG